MNRIIRDQLVRAKCHTAGTIRIGADLEGQEDGKGAKEQETENGQTLITKILEMKTTAKMRFSSIHHMREIGIVPSPRKEIIF